MDRDEKIRFVAELGQSVLEDIYANINNGKVPENWDGIELRRYMAERFNRAIMVTMSRKRKADYENDILVNDL